MFPLVAGILCFFKMLTPMPESVMPAISMSSRSSAMPKRSASVNLSAFTPAPPEWMSVPSISKRRSRLFWFVISIGVEISAPYNSYGSKHWRPHHQYRDHDAAEKDD